MGVVHNSITEEGSQQEKVLVSSEPQHDGQAPTEEETPVTKALGNNYLLFS